MYQNYKIVVTTPSGRREYQSLLLRYIKKNFHIIDEYRIWLNTKKESDVLWLKSLPNNFSKIKLDCRKKVNSIKTIGQYFDKCTENDTIYIRLDDDIIYLHENFFENLIKFRIENPEYFLISTNIINNYHCFQIQKRLGLIKNIENITNPKNAEKLHNFFIKILKRDCAEELYFEKQIAKKYERININSICWFGSDMSKVYKMIGNDEEANLNNLIPKKLNKYNCVCGNALSSHFSFYKQIDYLKKTNILNKYKNIKIKY